MQGKRCNHNKSCRPELNCGYEIEVVDAGAHGEVEVVLPRDGRGHRASQTADREAGGGE